MNPRVMASIGLFRKSEIKDSLSPQYTAPEIDNDIEVLRP